MAGGVLRGGAEGFVRKVEPQQSRVAPTAERYGLEEAGIGRHVGPKISTRPQAVRSLALAGKVRQSLFEEYYNRVYVIPGVLDFGSVAAEKKLTFYVWNAWLKDTTIYEVLTENSEGTELQGLPALPHVYRPLALVNYTGVAFEDGPSSFTARYVLRFDTGEDMDLMMIGERARLLPFLPNWRESYTVTLEFKTDLWASRSGREQRRALRQSARKSIGYTATVQKNALRAFNRHMNTWQNKTIIMPEEPAFATVSLDALGGNTAFALDAIPQWLEVGGAIYIRNLDGENAITNIASIVGTTIETAGVIDIAVPAGSKVLQAQYGRLEDSISSTRETSTVAEVDIAFNVTPGTEARETPFTALTDFLDDRPIFLLKPNWSQTPKLSYLWPAEILDYGTGRTTITNTVEYAQRSLDYLFTGRAPEDIKRIVDLFIQMRGRARDFFWPSWENDLPFDSPCIEGTRTMEFEGDEMFLAYVGDPTHKAVIIMLEGGEFFANAMIEEPVFSEGRSIFTFKENWPRTYQPGEPVKTCWLYSTRFGTDKLTVEWLTRTVATVKTNFLTLEVLPYEL